MADMRTLLLAAVVLATAGLAQGPTRSPSVTLPTAPDDAARWIKQLGSDRYRDRLEAENKLRSMGAKAKAALEAAAADERDVEVQWRAKRLLVKLKQPTEDHDAAGLGLRKRKPGLVDRGVGEQEPQDLREDSDRHSRQSGGDIGEMRAEIERMIARMEKDLGMKLPRHEFFDGPLLKNLKTPLSTRSDSQGMSVQVGPNGVHVEVTETGEDGKVETKVYDAPNMEAFKKSYPGVLRENEGGLGLMPFGVGDLPQGLDALRGRVGALQRGFEWQLLKPQVIPFDRNRKLSPNPDAANVSPLPRLGERLGIVIKEIPAALSDYLELPLGTGLMVDSVQAGTLAEALGLKANDIVVSINESRIGSPVSVQKALSDIPKGGVVAVKFVRRGERHEVKTKKLRDAKSSAGF